MRNLIILLAFLASLILAGCTAAEAGSFYSSPPTGGGGGGASVTQAAYASCGTGSAAGDICVTTDGPLWRVWDGSAWDDYLPGYGAVTPPVCGDFSWVNQGAATCDNVGGVMRATAPASAGNVYHLLVESTPGSSWTADAVISYPPRYAASMAVSLVARDATGGDFIEAFHSNFDNAAAEWTIQRWTNATTFSACASGCGVVDQTNRAIGGSGTLRVRLSSNGTTLTYSAITPDGRVQVLETETIATFVGTVDQVGIGIRTYGATIAAPFTVLHWSVQ